MPADRSTPSATLADVARRAGVSLATASRALNGSATRQVGEALRARVQQAAADLDYSPNAQAQAMARGTTATVGLVVHDIADPYFAAIAAGVIEAAADRGLLVTVASTQRDPGTELRHVELLRQARAQAVVLAGSRLDDPALLDRMRSALRAFTRGGGRAACIGQDVLGVSTVVVENRLGASALAGALHRAGHRRFGILAGPPTHLTARDRTEGFCYGLSELGAEPAAQHVVACEFTWDGAYAATKALLAAGADPGVDCVFAVTDVMALGALAALRDAGLRVPGDVGVAGFDDVPSLRDVVPPLTTVRLPMVGMGAAAVELAFDGDPGVDCVFAVTDVMALGALAALRDAGLRVPGDVGVAGFDDVPSLRDVVPPLTTVRLPMVGMGAAAVELAFDGDPASPRRVPVRGEIVLRDSTARTDGRPR